MRTKIRLVSGVFILFFLIIVTACQKQKTEWKGTIEEKNGVVVMSNPKDPLYDKDIMSLEEELTIGDVDKESEPLFIDISSVRIDYEENIYVLDYKACQIKVFDKNGRHLRIIGRKGQGPGEMQLPTMMEMVSGKEIMIYDLPNNRISFFSLQGELLYEISKGKFFRLLVPMPDSKRNFIGSMRYQIGEKRLDELMKFDSNFRQLFTIDRLEYTDEPNVIYPFPPFILYIVLEDDKVLWGNWLHYHLQIADEVGKTTRKIIKDYDPVEITDEDRERDFEERFGGSGVPPDIKLEFPRYYPAFWHLSTDDGGRIFVQTFERTGEGSYYYDVFDSDGKYMVKIPLKVRPRAWKKGKLYTVEADEEGYQVVKRYKVAWKY